MNLTALQHSSFLQSLGWAIANSLWQVAALWIFYIFITLAHKNASARFKTNTAIALLTSSFLWFCYTFLDRYFSTQNNFEISSISKFYQREYYSNTTAQWHLVLNKITAALPYLSIAYLLLLLFLSIRLINSYRYTNFIKTNGLQKPIPEWKIFTERVARHIGISKRIVLWVSNNIDVPATIGFFKPVILIPVASINQLSADQLEAIILHELSHIKRNDYLINIFISLVETILFFNPFIVLLSKIIKRERENCCDDFVIQYQYDRHSYASALLSLEKYRNTNLRLAISATSGKKQLLNRVKRIMEARNNMGFNYGQKIIALLLITGIFCSFAWLSPETNKKQHQKITLNTQKFIPQKVNGLNAPSNNNPKILHSTSIMHQNVKEINDQIINTDQLNIEKKSVNLANKINEQQIMNEGMDLDDMENAQAETRHEPVNKSEALLSLKKLSSFNFNTKEWAASAMQKYQYVTLQNNFKKFFVYKNIENDVKQALDNLQKNISKADVFKNLKNEEIEILINSLIKNNKHTQEKKQPINSPLLNYITSTRSVSAADSLFSEKRKVFNNYLRMATVKDVSRLESPNKVHTPSAAPMFGYTYTSKEGYSSSSPLRTRAAKTDNRIEYNNGVITINGKVVNPPSPDDNYRENIIAKVKGKKLSIISGDNIVEININD